jgi:hypothetical protein
MPAIWDWSILIKELIALMMLSTGPPAPLILMSRGTCSRFVLLFAFTITFALSPAGIFDGIERVYVKDFGYGPLYDPALTTVWYPAEDTSKEKSIWSVNEGGALIWTVYTIVPPGDTSALFGVISIVYGAAVALKMHKVKNITRTRPYLTYILTFEYILLDYNAVT